MNHFYIALLKTKTNYHSLSLSLPCCCCRLARSYIFSLFLATHKYRHKPKNLTYDISEGGSCIRRGHIRSSRYNWFSTGSGRNTSRRRYRSVIIRSTRWRPASRWWWGRRTRDGFDILFKIIAGHPSFLSIFITR